MNIREWNRRNAEISKKYDALYHRIAAKHGLSDLQHWVLYVIRSMDGEKELTQMIQDEQDGAELTCHFCKTTQKFTQQDLLRLLNYAVSK